MRKVCVDLIPYLQQGSQPSSPSHAVDSIIASERNGVEVRVRVILHTVGNFVDTSIKNYVEHYVMATYGQI